MAFRMTPSPAARTLFQALGAEESPRPVPSAALDIEAADLADYMPTVDRPAPVGYDLSIKRKRNMQILRQMLANAGLGDLAQNVNIRQRGMRPQASEGHEYD